MNGALSAGSETRTRTIVKSQVFETSASTIPPFPHVAFDGHFSKADANLDRFSFTRNKYLFFMA